jgi:hypothetical protein
MNIISEYLTYLQEQRGGKAGVLAFGAALGLGIAGLAYKEHQYHKMLSDAEYKKCVNICERRFPVEKIEMSTNPKDSKNYYEIKEKNWKCKYRCEQEYKARKVNIQKDIKSESYLQEQPITKYVLLTGADRTYQRVFNACNSKCGVVAKLLNTKCQMQCKAAAAEAAIEYLNSRGKACDALNDPETCKEYVDTVISRYEANINKLRAKISYLET